jgi:hypothetical protein
MSAQQPPTLSPSPVQPMNSVAAAFHPGGTATGSATGKRKQVPDIESAPCQNQSPALLSAQAVVTEGKIEIFDSSQACIGAVSVHEGMGTADFWMQVWRRSKFQHSIFN